MRCAIVIALVLGGLVLCGAASASRPATSAELNAMMRAGFATGPGSFTIWARISTRDGHYGIVYAKRCQNPAFCGSHIRPTYGFLVHRPTTSARSRWILFAQAQLHPPYRPEVTRLCRAAPKAVRADLLTATCCG
jgi:hypothetical protein